MKNLRIAFCGTHGTGKTTLVREIAKEMKISMISGVARKMIKRYKKLEVRQKYMIKEIKKLEKQKSFISDRSIIDFYSYGGIDYLNGIRDFKEHFGYDFLFYVPIEFPMQNDGVRPEDETFRKGVDEKIKKGIKRYLFKNKNTKFYTVSGSLQNRMIFLKTKLGFYVTQ